MADTKPKKSKQQVTLKRRVTVKAIVTDKFKEYLKFELEETIRTGKIRVKEIETAVANLDVNDPSRIQMLSEKKQIEDTVSQAPQQESAIKELENDTRKKTDTYYRVWNEVPACIMVLIVLLIIIKPF